MELIWIMLVFFLFITILFVVLAFAFPEWFGITGKKALEVQKHQQENPEGAPENTEHKKDEI
ncbi:hypothetical protein [Pseudobdellovibrio exovorus]|uniref:Uncharacterized protein n=1 Tax=Pseudobdellovibrio exovorus JSS TaxID=1184267 RepID=M4VRH4_9BACT|nr:hypothetical protein [Pseudobdellovibrio exovorus]AGH95784.1 hypothetical protein A11Q_1568 [Pseudobdellovibrio exovorus JSS]